MDPSDPSTGKLTPLALRDWLPTLGKDGPTLHHRCGRVGPPAGTERFSSHPGTQRRKSGVSEPEKLTGGWRGEEIHNLWL